MKTTVELSDALLQEAQAVAREQRTTVRALLEEGLFGAPSPIAGRRAPRHAGGS